MSQVPRRINGHVRVWLESPSPPSKAGNRIAKGCTVAGCGTWVFGWTKQEVAKLMAAHCERCH